MLDEERLKKVLATVLDISPSAITDDASTDTIPEWDSLKHMNLILALEEEYGIVIPDEDVGNITSYPLIRLMVGELAGR